MKEMPGVTGASWLILVTTKRIRWQVLTLTRGGVWSPSIRNGHHSEGRADAGSPPSAKRSPTAPACCSDHFFAPRFSRRPSLRWRRWAPFLFHESNEGGSLVPRREHSNQNTRSRGRQ